MSSSEATPVSKELFFGILVMNCHGIFSFHLIEGLEGKATNPETGVITLESLSRHIENQMKAEGKQIDWLGHH